MRKGIAVLIMIFVSVGFYMSLNRMKPVKVDKTEIVEVLEEIDEKINTKYPSDAVEIIKMHNTLMDQLYGEELTEEEIVEIVWLQRSLYEEGFSELTPEEKQLEKINQELLANKEKGLKMLTSKITSSYEEPLGVMNIEVTHYTNQVDIMRHYLLRKETEEETQKQQWKIYGWQNINPSDVEKEEE